MAKSLYVVVPNTMGTSTLVLTFERVLHTVGTCIGTLKVCSVSSSTVLRYIVSTLSKIAVRPS